MLKHLLATTCVVLSFAFSQAHASVLVPGLTFDVTLGTYDSVTKSFPELVTTTVAANGFAVFSYGSASVTVTEFESTLATGQQSVTISLLSDSDLFPETGTDSLTGALGVGIYGNGLQFSSPFDLGSAVVTYRTATGTFATADSVANGLITQTNPYNGVYLSSRNLGGFPGVQNQGVNNIQLQLTTPLAATPEPSSFVLLATGLLGMAGTLKRRFF